MMRRIAVVEMRGVDCVGINSNKLLLSFSSSSLFLPCFPFILFVSTSHPSPDRTLDLGVSIACLLAIFSAHYLLSLLHILGGINCL